MKILNAVMAGLMVLGSVPTEAAVKSFRQKNRITIIQDGVQRYEDRTEQYPFRVEILSDDEGLKTEHLKNDRPTLFVEKGERYSVRVHNPLPVRVVVNLTIDGLNSLTGKPSGISGGAKWIIDPYSYITVRGWQVNEGESRRFFFTEKPKSYAAWQDEKWNKNLSINCGVIGAAFFWNKQELQQYFDNNPQYVYTHHRFRCGVEDRAEGVSSGVAAPQALQESESLKDSTRKLDAATEYKSKTAGTGMGERESNPTQLVDFHYDTGMYKLSQAVVLYYELGSQPNPQPFPNLSYAPEMP